jgi:hypothetical protein
MESILLPVASTRDVADSQLVTYRGGRRRWMQGRGHEWLGALLERQQ